ncbi:MAG: hypothetical protein LC725_03930 [Lentisphaerae bacterium]|nr:hypothetical protein [Lentisphaerota bacterium]
MIRIRIKGGRIESLDQDGGRLKEGTAGKDDTAVIQDAVDRLEAEGCVLLSTGQYRLTAPIGVHLPGTIRGEGRGTEVLPPANDFAFKVSYDGRCPDRTITNFGVAPAHADKADWQKRLDEREDRPGNRMRLQGVHICELAIQGNGQGKGIFLKCLTESTFRDLWINGTADGAALYLDVAVMECVFENLHLSNCGSPANREATIAMPSRNGNGANNLHLRGIYVIFPQYIGIEIGSDDMPGDPRLVWFEHCMLHGWHQLTTPAPYDLIRVNRTNPERGIAFSDCRIGMGANDADPENRHLYVRQGRVALEGCVIGGGQSKRMLQVDAGGVLYATGNTFHGQVAESVLQAEGAAVTFANNHIDVRHGPVLLDLRSPRLARIMDNDVQLSDEQGMLRLTDTMDAPAGPMKVTGNFLFGAAMPLQCELASGAAVIERDNVCV